MLTDLSIKNFAIIEELTLEFQQKLTVLTGETGAGKSIIVDTLDLVLGARADAAMIRQGQERCEIIATFDLSGAREAKSWLSRHEFASDIDQCIIRRMFSRDGRTRSSINDIPCTQQIVRELGGLLLSIYGQHEHQTLLKKDQQLYLLDAFAQHKDLCASVAKAYRAVISAHAELADLQNNAKDRDAKIALLRHELQELDGIKLSENEVEKLEQELYQLNNAKEIISDLNCAQDLINQDDDASSIIKSLYVAKNKVEKNKSLDVKLNNALELITNSTIQIETAYDEIKHYIHSLELNSERLETIESRLDAIYELARKHHVEPKKLPEIQQTLDKELIDLEQLASLLKQGEERIKILETEYLRIANQLSSNRHLAASKFETLVTEKMQLLNLFGGEFKIRFSKERSDFNAHGLEGIEFLVSTNSGQPLLPLSKIASGGELSRIGLAIQVITQATTITPILIFDEVDVGIGGKTAEIVGKLLSELSNSVQIICITHLPQVAIYGIQHLKVEKHTNDNMIGLTLSYIQGKARVGEIARMLGGINVTQKTLVHAEEMLNLLNGE